MQTITGRSAFLSLLKDEGISYLFGNPGTTELPIMDALSDHPDMKYVLGLQEAIVVAMADGYARASHRLSACNVHVAPGLGNAMGSLYNAKWYGSPLLITAGQQEQGHGLTEPLLYDPLVPIATPLVKWAVEVTRLADLSRIVRRAAKIALSPPTGPVFISLPGDILNDEATLDLAQSTRIDAQVRPSDSALTQLAARLLNAENPVLVCGHEINSQDALDQASRLAELLGAPVYQQSVPYSTQYYSEHRAFMGALSRNQQQVRALLEPHDLLIALGGDVLRMSVWSPVEPLPTGMPIVQIGLRDWEIAKNYPVEIAIKADLRETLDALLPIVKQQRDSERAALAERRLGDLDSRNWLSQREQLKQQIIGSASSQPIDAALLMLRVAEHLPFDAVVVDEGLTSSSALLRLQPLRDRSSYFGLASGGIGFAVAGAIGIHLALPGRPMLAIIGDGSAMYNIQALWTAAHLHLPITYMIANNKSYRILKDRLLAFQGNDHFIGMDFRDPEIDFVALAQSLGVQAERIDHGDAIGPALQRALAHPEPSLLDVMIADGYGNQ